jgi:antigen flippase
MRTQVSTVMASRFFRLAAGVITTILTARLLGPTGQGEYFFVVTLAALIVQFGNLGLHSSNMYQVGREPRSLGSLTTNSIWVAGVAGAGLATCAVAVTYFLNASSSTVSLALFAVILAPLGLFFLLGESLLLGLRRTAAFNSVEILGSLALVLAQVAAGLWTRSPFGFLAARSVGILISSAGLLVMLTRGAQLQKRFDADTFRDGFFYSARAYVVALLGYLVLRMNVFLLQVHSGFSEVGFYSVATQVADALEIIPTSVSLVLFPRLVRMESLGWPLMAKALVAVAAVMAVVCILVALFCEPLIAAAFGSEFRRTAAILRLMLPQVFFIGMTSIVSQYLAALGMPMIVLAAWAVALVVVIVLGMSLIPTYSSEGAAVALSLTYAGVFALMLVVAAARRPRA